MRGPECRRCAGWSHACCHMRAAFGQSGAGVFFAPTVIASQVCDQYRVVQLGRVDNLVEQVYAITTERRLKHPATLVISRLARDSLFA